MYLIRNIYVAYKDEEKKADLVAHIIRLLESLEATEKVITQEVVLNEDHIVQTVSLKCDVQDALETLFKKDPSLAFQISQGHELLNEYVQKLDKVTLS